MFVIFFSHYLSVDCLKTAVMSGPPGATIQILDFHSKD